MFNWIDNKFLESTKKILKRWNWLTGRDQFFLSRAILGVYFIFLLLNVLSFSEASIPWLLNSLVVLCFVLVLVIIFLIPYRQIRAVERIRLKEQENGVKFIELDLILKQARRNGVFWCILTFIFYLILSFVSSSSSDFVFWVFYYLVNAFIKYLLSLDLPPFQKSQVWEWVKSLFEAPQLSEAKVIA